MFLFLDIELYRLRQEDNPSIEYKYLLKTIAVNPKQSYWWKRGTHRIYADEDKPELIFA